MSAVLPWNGTGCVSGQKTNGRSHESPRGKTLGPDPGAHRLRRRNGGTALRVSRIAAVLALAVLLATQIPARVSAPSPGPEAYPAASAVSFRTDASPAEIAGAGARLLETYGAFSVARGPPAALAELRSLGRYAAPLAGASYLHLVSGDVDVRGLAASPLAPWTPDAAGLAPAVVHFLGPIKPAWQTALETRGVTVLRYLPTDAYLVRGSPAALDGLRSLPFVDFVGPYEASWKLRPGMPAQGPAVDVRIVVLPGASPEAVRAWLARAGVPPKAPSPTSAGIDGIFGSGDFRWVRARLDAGHLGAVAALPQVEFIDPVYVPRAFNAETDWVIQTNRIVPANGSRDYRYWWNGLNGLGQFVGIADTGLDFDGAQFRHAAGSITTGDLYNVTDPARRKVVRYVDMGVLIGQLAWPGSGGPWDPFSAADCAYNGASNGHGTAVASTLAGNDQGIGSSPNDGNALAAQIYMQDVGGLAQGAACGSSTEGLIYLPEDYGDIFGPPGLVYNDPLAPVRIHSDSWGADTNAYDVQARAVDAFVWSHPDMTIFFAAGNAGPNAATVGTPGTAKDIVTVGGALNPDGTIAGNQNDLASFSSRGPASDGRIKPTILTIADGDSATSDGNPWDGVTSTADHAWAGTSYATPAAAAAAAIVRQYFTDGWYPTASPVPGNGFSSSAALIRAMLIASGVQVTGAGTAGETTWPNSDQGFGRVLLSNVLPLSAAGDTFRTQIVDQRAGLLTGQVQTYTFRVNAGSNTLRFVLTWTDYPGTLGASKALVNDLDLEVTAPNGTVYRGNNFGTFAAGQSVPGGSFDATNVEEAVLLKTPAPGDWKVRVIGSGVPVGPQPYALVATGGLDPNYGRVFLDRPTYGEASVLALTVEDGDAAAVQVLLASTLEPAGETVTLTRGAAGEVWRGSIPLAFGQPAADGILEVRDGDTITAVYQDLSPAHTATARATVDATSPAVFGVTADEIGTTSARIRWSTDRPADTEVVFGDSPTNLTDTASDPELMTGHSLSLRSLRADTVYFYDVVSSDRLGHATTDDNGGRHYAFRTPLWGDVLVVIGADSFGEEREASYADALNGTGWSWSFWRVADLGLPPLSLLQDRRAVLWQVGLEQYPAFNATARALIKAYLDGGGRLLVTSHDTAWSLGSGPATASPSAWYTPESAAWLQGVLKVSFSCDPTTTAQMNGVAGDPVSGAFTGSNGIAYTAHRPGAADDQILFPNGGAVAGGTSYLAWTDSNVVQGCTRNQPVGLRWVSSAANGTAGAGAWGGTPARLAYFAFELTGLDTNATDLRPTSGTRAQVIDNALRWLVGTATATLDRDHPTVAVTAPNGGTFNGPTIPINWTATATGPGITLANFSLSYSPDVGQTWTPIATVPGTDRGYAWGIGAVPNGRAYVVRVVAQDSGTPSLQGVATTNRTFTISRPGGDALGPTMWAGSLRVRPDPPGAAQPATINATADDSRTGGGAVVRAEFFLSATRPTGANGTGFSVLPVDGAFDQPIENVTRTDPFAIAPGTTCIWIHAGDAAGNWGPFLSICMPVLSVGPDVTPPAPASLDSIETANGGADLVVTWQRAWDDGLYGGTARYRVLRAASPTGPYGPVGGNLTATGNQTYAFVDLGGGIPDPSDEFYRIQTFDAADNVRLSLAIAVKVRQAVAQGLNFLGMPAEPGPVALGAMAAGVSWTRAWAFDACDGGFGWKTASPGSDAGFGLHAGDGFWMNVSAAGELLVLGITAERTQVRLCAGWNLVALPGFATNWTAASVKAATAAEIVMGFDPTDPYRVRVLASTEGLVPGHAYWIRVRTTAVWSVPGW